MTNFVTSQIRTYAPLAAGAIIAWLTTMGLELDANTQTGLIIFITGLSQGLYYFTARFVGKKFPKLETIMLASSKKPDYE